MNLFSKRGEAISTTLPINEGFGRWWQSAILQYSFCTCRCAVARGWLCLPTQWKDGGQETNQ